MRIRILGSGTSHGVPMIGCHCSVCTSTNPRNKRFRPSITVENEGRLILVDSGPDLRSQCLANGIERMDALFVTHTHADHIFGMDEVRRFNDLMKVELPVYGDDPIFDDLKRTFSYVFKQTQKGGGKPRVKLTYVEPAFNLYGMAIRSFHVMHGKLPVLAYRFNDAAYVTDVNHIPDDAMEQLRGLKLLILDAVRPEPHSTHFGLYEALDVIDALRPEKALLTHLSHLFDHDEVNATLPPSVRLAFDGQVIRIADDGTMVIDPS